MPRAICLVRDTPHYRRASIVAGLRRLGYAVQGRPSPPIPSDVLVTWNRHGSHDIIAQRYEQAGCKVVVCENGYIGADTEGCQLYAMALRHHNGAGWWPVGSEDRWSRLGIELKPWRTKGHHILVLPQRGVGPAGVAMPVAWGARTQASLRKTTKRPVRLRSHPGSKRPPLEPDLAGAHACVVWASSAGIKAIVAGVPVFHGLKSWIGAPAARCDLAGLENPYLGDRLPMLQRLAYAQWSVAEIQTGEPFARLLER